MKTIKQALLYISAFESKNISQLKGLMGPEIRLRDWVLDVNGLEEVLAEIGKIFATYKVINIKPVNLYNKKNTVISELKIFLDNETLDVVDIIEFDDDLKIVDIRAFKR